MLALCLAPILGPFLDPYVLPVHGETNLLDVGCGSGWYLSRMRALGWNVLGVDRSPRAAAQARALYRVPVVVGTVPSPELPAGEFDVVTVWQVLEHLDRPRAALAAIRDLLRPAGRLVLTVPNQSGWAARRFGPNWIGLDLPRHLSHFTTESLERMLRLEGFRVVHQATLGRSGWIRHSARRAFRSGGPIRQRVFRSKTLSRAASALATRRGNGEAIYIVAERTHT